MVTAYVDRVDAAARARRCRARRTVSSRAKAQPFDRTRARATHATHATLDVDARERRHDRRRGVHAVHGALTTRRGRANANANERAIESRRAPASMTRGSNARSRDVTRTVRSSSTRARTY